MALLLQTRFDPLTETFFDGLLQDHHAGTYAIRDFTDLTEIGEMSLRSAFHDLTRQRLQPDQGANPDFHLHGLAFVIDPETVNALSQCYWIGYVESTATRDG